MSKSKHGARPPGHMSTRSNLVSSASKKSVIGGMAPSDKSSNLRVPVQVRLREQQWIIIIIIIIIIA